MRIGELATAVGVTTRTVRHYHHPGLLPKPERRADGYRDCTLRHAVGPARIR
ncbi:MerR family DNA-binding transcriptional regulator, partial [Streptomyces hirsutus]|uniref:MerR family DNA-binding transcriptional regulator n=1 Tax=Streptomyces hirsutus TaxID=35620 RepID=UPI0033DBB0CB